MNDYLLYMREEWGPVCDDYEPGCACCEAWLLFNRTGEPPTFEQVKAAVNAALNQEDDHGQDHSRPA